MGSTNEDAQQALQSTKEALHSHDFYLAYLLNFCEGDFINNSSHEAVKRNITKCSHISMNHVFDPRRMIRDVSVDRQGDDLGAGWPDDLSNGFDALLAWQRAIAACYSLATVSTAVALAVSLAGFCFKRLCSIAHALLLALSTIALLIANVVITVVVVQAEALVRVSGSYMGLGLGIGVRFLICTWAAWLATAVAAVAPFLLCCCCC